MTPAARADRISEAGLAHLGLLRAGSESAGETLLFLHGWGASKEIWWQTLARLSGEFQCLAPDLPGTGRTPLGSSSARMPDLADWLDSVLERLRLPPVTLVGHSMGGNLAARFALGYPHRVRRLILADAALDARRLPQHTRLPLSPRYGLAALGLMRWASGPFGAAGRYVSHANGGRFVRPQARRVHLYLRHNTDAALLTQLWALWESRVDAHSLSALRMPLLLMHGRLDALVPVAQSRALAAALPGAQYHEFPRADHCPMDSAGEEFADAIRRFVQI